MRHRVFGVILAGAMSLAATAAAGQSGAWEGPYVGAFAGTISFPSPIVGVQGGYAFEVADNVYLGPEVDAFYVTSTGMGAVSGTARLGLALSDAFEIYGRAGGFAFGNGDTGWLVGGGAEVKVTDSISLFGGVDRYDCGCVYNVARAGVQLSF